MSYQSPIEIIYGELKLETENAITRAVQQVGINVDKEELQKALAYDRHMYERGRRDRDSEIVRCKDCKHRFNGRCYGRKSDRVNFGVDVPDDWFCADADSQKKGE